jgi:hypothetical protein
MGKSFHYLKHPLADGRAQVICQWSRKRSICIEVFIDWQEILEELNAQ